MDFSQIGDLTGCFDGNNVTEPDSEILSNSFVHSDFAIFELVVGEGNN